MQMEHATSNHILKAVWLVCLKGNLPLHSRKVRVSTAGRGTTAVVTRSRSSVRETTARAHDYYAAAIQLLCCAALISQQLVMSLQHTHTVYGYPGGF